MIWYTNPSTQLLGWFGLVARPINPVKPSTALWLGQTHWFVLFCFATRWWRWGCHTLFWLLEKHKKTFNEIAKFLWCVLLKYYKGLFRLFLSFFLGGGIIYRSGWPLTVRLPFIVRLKCWEYDILNLLWDQLLRKSEEIGRNIVSHLSGLSKNHIY